MIIFNEICETTQGVQISKANQVSGPLNGYERYLYISDLLHDKNLKYIKNEFPHKIVTEDDLVVANTGSPGKVFKGKYGVLSNNLFRLSFDSKTANRDYLYYILSSETFQNSLQKQMKGGIQKHLGHKTMGKQKIPLPPIDQQKKIAAILDAADAYRQKTKALIEKYDALTQSLFLDMFGDPVSNPKGWNEVIFTEVLVLRRGFDLPRQDRIKGEYPIMASNGILDWHNEFKVEGPGIVTGRSGTLGKVHYIEGDYWPLNTALYSQKLNGNNPIYLIYLIRNFRVERFSRGAGVPTLNRNLVHAETIMTVPIELQNQFADRVQAIEAQKAQAKASLAQAEDLFNSLLQRAFKGELTN